MNMFSGKTTLSFIIKDSIYLQHVLHFLRQSDYFQVLQIRAFTRIPAQESLNDTDILVVCDEIAISEKELNVAKMSFILSTDRNAALSDGFIFKYQPLNKMLRDVLDYFMDKYRQAIDDSKVHSLTSVISIYSLAGGSGKTTVATGFAELLANEGYKVLYLNLEDVPPPIWSISEEISAPTLTEYLYQLDNGSTNIMYWTGKHHPQRRFYFLQPQVQFREMSKMDKQKFDWMIQNIRQNGYFDYVIVDMVTQLNPLTFDCFNVSDHICWLLTDDQTHLGKMEMLLSYAKQTEMLEEWSWLGKCSFVLNKYMGYFLNASLNETYEICAYLPNVNSWNHPMNNSFQTLEENQFEQALKKLFAAKFAIRSAIPIHG